VEGHEVDCLSPLSARRAPRACEGVRRPRGPVGLPCAGVRAVAWERAASNLEATFTGPLARSLALVAIVIGGLMFMFGEDGAKRQISGIVFGGGLALFAAQFLAWLF
jgi:type IV secretory pathway VirB2 component (pilin)